MVETPHKKDLQRLYDALPLLVVVIGCLFVINGNQAWNTVVDSVATDTFNTSISDVDAVPKTPLVDWFEAKGAKVNFDIKTDKTGQRGAFAAFDMAPKSTVFAAPLSACIPLKGATPSYQAFNLLIKMQKDPEFTRDYLQYWTSLPLSNETFSAELFTDDHIKALHTPELEKLVLHTRTQAVGVYLGFGKESGGITCVTNNNIDNDEKSSNNCSLAAALGEKGPISEIIPIATFMHMTALISSRHFAVEPAKDTLSSSPSPRTSDDDTKNVDASTKEQQQYYLVPVVDLLNYSHDNANVDVINDGKHLTMVTNRPVNEGEQLYFDYLPGVGHRNDINLISYGFLHDYSSSRVVEEENNHMPPPLMAAVDVPTFQKKEPYAESPEDDEIFYGEEGYFRDDAAELERLQQLLDDMPTSAKEDEEELSELNEKESEVHEGLMYWKEKFIVEYRLQRRRAIEYNAQRIRDNIVGFSSDGGITVEM